MKHYQTIASRIVPLLIIGLVAFNFLTPTLGTLNSVNAVIDSSNLLDLHNRERIKQGLTALEINPILAASANRKAEAMLQSDCWSHYCPNGRSPWEFFKDMKYDYLYAGENLAEGFYENDTVMKAWVNSPTHMANIVNGRYTEVGFGFARGSFQGKTDNLIVVAHFGNPNPSNSVFASGATDLTLGKPEINTPANNLITAQTTIEVTGQSVGAEQIKLVLDGEQVDSVKVTDNKFSFRYVGLADDRYLITAQGRKGDKVGPISDPITFTVDTKANPITPADVKIYKGIWGDRLEVVMPEMQKITMEAVGLSTSLGMNAQRNWETTQVPKPLTTVNFTTVDIAGNSVTHSLDLNQATMLEDGRLLPNLSIKTLINIGIIALIIVSLLLDLYYRERYNGGQIKNRGHYRWHIGILLVLIVILVLNNIAGTVLEGIAI